MPRAREVMAVLEMQLGLDILGGEGDGDLNRPRQATLPVIFNDSNHHVHTNQKTPRPTKTLPSNPIHKPETKLHIYIQDNIMSSYQQESLLRGCVSRLIRQEAPFFRKS